MNIAFHAFSLVHLAILGMVPALAAILAGVHRRTAAGGTAIRIALAAILGINSLDLYASIALRGEPLLPAHLPLELCDASVWLMVAVLLTRRPALFDIAWYWGVAGAGMALFTPNFTQNTLFMWVQYFVSHGLIVAAALYLVWSGQMRPRPGSVARALLAANLFALVAGTCDYVYGTNYMYLRQKPQAATLLDVLGPWPWYILACEFVGLGLFVLLYLPFRGSRARKLRRQHESAEPELEAPAPLSLNPSASSSDR
jgi:hypothetical integral membrane protein (TIGR02206 family)